MRRILNLAPRGYYECLHEPISDRALEDARLLIPAWNQPVVGTFKNLAEANGLGTHAD